MEMVLRDGKAEREEEREKESERGSPLSMCCRASHAEPIANKPSVEISKEVITTGPAQFLTVDARLPPWSRIDLNEEAMNILEGRTPHTPNLNCFDRTSHLCMCVCVSACYRTDRRPSVINDSGITGRCHNV